MNATEANVLLTRAALLDPRVRYRDMSAEAAADQAVAWASVLSEVPLEFAMEVLTDHYRSSDRTLTPATVIRSYTLRSIEWI